MREDLVNKLYVIKEKIFSFINEAESIVNRIVLLGVIVVVIVWINLDRIIDMAVSENRIKSNLVTKLEEATGKKAEVKGAVSFKSRPEPIIVINDVRVQNDSPLTTKDYFHAETVKSKPSVFRAILGKINLDNIYFENVEINMGFSAAKTENVYDIIGKFFSKESQLYGKKLIFKNLSINIYKPSPIEGKNPVVRNYSFADLELIPNPEDKKNKYEVKGSIASRKFGEVYYFNIGLPNGFGKKSTYSGKIYSTDSDLKLSGNIDTEKALTFDGKIEGKFKGLPKKLISLLGVSEGFLESIRDNDESTLTTTFDFDGTTFNIKDFKAAGTIVELTLKSKTEIKEKISSAIEVNISKLDYSQMFKSYVEIVSEKKAKMIERDFKKKLEEYFLFAIGDDINFLFSLNAPLINFFHNGTGDLNIVALLKDGHFKIKNFRAKLPGDSDFNLIADVEIDKQEKRLKGSSRLLFGGKDMDKLYHSLDSTSQEGKERRFGPFYIDAKAFLYGQNIHLREIVAKINEDTFAGQMLVDYSNEFKASSALNFTSLNIDKYLLKEEKLEEGLVKSGNTLTSKFDFLRILDSVFDQLDISLLADNMVKAGNEYTDVSVYAHITPGITEIKDIFFNSDIMGQVKGKAHLDLTDFQPKLDLDLAIDNYDTDLLFYGEVVPQNDNYKFDGKWSTEKVTFEKLGNFSGKMNLHITNFRIYQFLMNNFVMKSHSEEGKFTIDQARADIFGNKIDFKGYLTTEYPSFSLSFIASELNSEKFMATTLALDQVYSIFNMSGVLASTGYSIDQMVQNLKGNLSVATKGFKVSGFDLVTISKALPLAKRREYIKLIGDELLNKGQTEFNFFIGSFNIDAGHITFTDLPIASLTLNKGTVSGNIDLPNWKLSVESKLVVNTADRRTFFLNGLTTGTIPNLTTNWDTTGLTKYWEDKFFSGR